MKKRKNKRRRSIFGKLLIFLEILILLPVLLLIISNQVIRFSAESHLFDSVEEISYNRVGLVLGTSPRIRNGGPNPYFNNRMEAAARLYHSGKVSYLLLSGDNRTRYYNEPEYMRRALIELDVPQEVIYVDNAGLRTLDSVWRAKEVFGQQSLTIISQRFHNQRAVFIAKQRGLDVVAYNAADVPQGQNDKTRIREWFAKANVFMDMLIQRMPETNNERIVIGNDQ